jgi:hypothetical protein
MSDTHHKKRRPAADGRLTVRFDELLLKIREAAASAHRTPSNWIKLVVRRELVRRGRLAA